MARTCHGGRGGGARWYPGSWEQRPSSLVLSLWVWRIEEAERREGGVREEALRRKIPPKTPLRCFHPCVLCVGSQRSG